MLLINSWVSYYFDDGVLKTNFNPVDEKISELNDDGYEFDCLDFFEQFYNTANEIYQQNSLAFDLIILNLPIIKKLFTRVFDIIQNNLHYYDSFTKALHVKTVVLLSHKKPDSHINVKVEFGEDKGKVPLDNIAKRVEE